MGREIRKVPAGWEHPRYGPRAGRLAGEYQPQFEETVSQRMAEDPESVSSDPNYYRPEHLEGGDHFQLYENTTEGTPRSPVFASVADLLNHLVKQGDDAGNVWPPQAVEFLRQGNYIPTSEAVRFGV